MGQIVWLHLSDLHARASHAWESEQILTALVDDLSVLRTDHKLQPDLVFFTGDVTFGHLPDDSIENQFERAGSFFARILSACKITGDRFFIVPGNHDVDRRMVTANHRELLQSQTDATFVNDMMANRTSHWPGFLERLGPYRNFLNNFPHLLDDPSRLIFAKSINIRGIKLGIAGLNSAWSCGQDGEKGKLWSAGRYQASRLNQELITGSPNLTLALIHHPCGWFTEYEATAFEQQLERDYDVCLHGHEHNGWVTAIQRPQMNHVRIASAACYDRATKENGYSVVRFDSNAKRLEIWLREYDRAAARWKARIIPGRTDPRGVWRVELKGSSESGESHPDRRAHTIDDLFEWPREALLPLLLRGLRSYDQEAAEVFPALLPHDPGAAQGPGSLRLWKAEIEKPVAGNAIAIRGLIGPVGCGKSSFLRAGLIPSLDEDLVDKVIICKATPHDTEADLLNELCAHYSSLPKSKGLVACLNKLKTNPRLRRKKKVVIILDQFEQWLHSHNVNDKHQLKEALEQPDRGATYTIFAVSEEFGTRLLEFIKCFPNPGKLLESYSVLQPFGKAHAHKLLVLFGYALGHFQHPKDLTAPETDFLTSALDVIVSNDRVVSVRFAMFIELFRTKERWRVQDIPRDFAQLTIAFMDSLFGENSTEPMCRKHRVAARELLERLLPEPQDINTSTGVVEQEVLRNAADYEDSATFDELLSLLISSLHLIEPTSKGARTYRLSHDYLVPALRTWLPTVLGGSTGKARIRLTALADAWNHSKNPKDLPDCRERWKLGQLIPPSEWKTGQALMMQAAKRRCYRRASVMVISAALVLTFGFFGWQYQHNYQLRKEALSWMGILRDVAPDRATSKITEAEVTPFRPFIIDYLKEDLEKTEVRHQSWRVARAGLQLFSETDPFRTTAGTILCDRLPVEEPSVAVAICEGFLQSRTPLTPEQIEKLWTKLKDAADSGEQNAVLRYSAALATLSPNDSRWSSAGYGHRLAESLVATEASQLGAWIKILSPTIGTKEKSAIVLHASRVHHDSRPHVLLNLVHTQLVKIGGDSDDRRRLLARSALFELFTLSDETLIHLLANARLIEFPKVFEEIQARPQIHPKMQAQLTAEIESYRKTKESRERDQAAERAAQLAIALFRLNSEQELWPLLSFAERPAVRSYLIYRLASLGVEADALWNRYQSENDKTIKAALLLALGEYPSVDATWSDSWIDTFQQEKDRGIHGAVEWLLTRRQDPNNKSHWQDRVDAAVERSRKNFEQVTQAFAGPAPPEWFVNMNGHTMVVVPPTKFQMGPEDGIAKESSSPSRTETITRRFAISSKEVSQRQFKRYVASGGYAADEIAQSNDSKRYAPTDDQPQVGVTWFAAASYCNWLSKLDGIPESEWCYEQILPADGKKPPRMRLQERHHELRGYRLPTEEEWECACRAGSKSFRCYGDSDLLLSRYSRYLATDLDDKTYVCGSLRPNDYGIFDMHGNVTEWCHVLLQSKGDRKTADDVITEEDRLVNDQPSAHFAVRGGSFFFPALNVHSGYRDAYPPGLQDFRLGFRLARTIDPPDCD